MKRFLCAAAIALASVVAYAQDPNYADAKTNFAVEKNGGTGFALRPSDFAVGADGECLSILSYAGGTFDWISCGGGLAAQAAFSALANATNGSAAPTAVAATSTAGTNRFNGQTLKYDDNAGTLSFQTYPVNPATEMVVWNDFMCRPSASGAATCGPDFLVTASGTSAGALQNPAITADANHPGILELTTGTTTSGVGAVGTQGLAATGGGGVIIGNGSVVEWDMYLPVLSGGTNTHTIRLGWGSVSGTGDHGDGCYFVLDSNSDTHWQIECSKGGVHTGPTASNLVATAAAYHKLRIEITGGAPHFYVDGTELNVSPLAGTNIPVIAVGVVAKITATAGCAASSTCVLDLDYVYSRTPVTR